MHYELDPYETERDAKRRHTKQDLECYASLREEFKSYTKANAPAGFSVRGGWNQIGKTEIALDVETTLRQFQEKLGECVTELRRVIDRFPGLK